MKIIAETAKAFSEALGNSSYSGTRAMRRNAGASGAARWKAGAAVSEAGPPNTALSWQQHL